jgi:hypothetical protein
MSSPDPTPAPAPVPDAPAPAPDAPAPDAPAPDAPAPDAPAPDAPAPDAPDAPDAPVPAPEETAKTLLSELVSVVDNVAADAQNVKKVFAFLKALEGRGYPVSDSVKAVEDLSKEITSQIESLSAELVAKKSSIQQLAEQLQNDLPSF